MRKNIKILETPKTILLPKHKELEQEAYNLLQKWRLNHWKFGWINGKTNLGICNYQKKTIALSRHWCLFLPGEENTETILHEIAHALTWEQYWIDVRLVNDSRIYPKMAKEYMSHGLVWNVMCKRVGAKPVKCYNGEIRLPDTRNL